MIDELSISSCPWEESCAQVGQKNYSVQARKECTAFLNQIKRVCGEPPTGARLKIKSNPHDFGSYLDVVVQYDGSNEKASEYAFNCEGSDKLAQWDDIARLELGLDKENDTGIKLPKGIFV
jgi:hypothetical protein